MAKEVAGGAEKHTKREQMLCGKAMRNGVIFGLCLSLIGIATGCRGPEPVKIPTREVCLPEIEKLHPLNSQLQLLEHPGASTSVTTEAFPGSRLPPPNVVPAPFLPPSGLPPNRVAEHQRTVHDDAARYIAQLESSAAERDREQVAAKRRAQEQVAAAQYAALLEKKSGELRDLAVVEARSVQHDLDLLNYRAESLASQSRVYTATGLNARRLLDDVHLQQIEIERRIQLKSSAVSGLLKADFHGLAIESLKAEKQALDMQVEQSVSEFSAQLEKTDKQEIAEARLRLDEQPSPIPSLQDQASVAKLPGAALLVQGIPAPGAVGKSAPMAPVGRATAPDAQNTKRAVDQLRSIIEADTKRAIEQIAHRDHWKPIYVTGPGNAWSLKVASAVKDQWRSD